QTEPEADRADLRMLRPSRELKWAHRGWRRFLDEPAASRTAGCIARLRFHLMTSPSVRFRTFPLKHAHCGNAVTPMMLVLFYSEDCVPLSLRPRGSSEG